MSFAVDLSNFEKNASGDLHRASRAFRIELFGSVIDATPVLSGRLRGNWQASIGIPKMGVTDDIDKDGDTGEPTKAKMIQALGRSEGLSFLVNNMPYAARIEYDGHSKQKAPAGMVRVNINRINEIMSKAVFDTRRQ